MASRKLQEITSNLIKEKNPGRLARIFRQFWVGLNWLGNRLSWLLTPLRWPFLAIIKIYQKTISPDHGLIRGLFPHGYCRFHPTCSEYGYQAIKKYGVVRGLVKAGWRIIRCNPWSAGGEDQP
jgi:putative membrane protein insertion efficiency factor